MIIQIFYAGLNFASRNLLDSAAGGTFMEITLGEATKLLDNIKLCDFSNTNNNDFLSTPIAPITMLNLVKLMLLC